MFVLKIIDENEVVSYYTIGDKVKLYADFNEAQKEIEVLERIEKMLFGDIVCIYEVVLWEENF